MHQKGQHPAVGNGEESLFNGEPRFKEGLAAQHLGAVTGDLRLSAAQGCLGSRVALLKVTCFVVQ